MLCLLYDGVDGGILQHGGANNMFTQLWYRNRNTHTQNVFIAKMGGKEIYVSTVHLP